MQSRTLHPHLEGRQSSLPSLLEHKMHQNSGQLSGTATARQSNALDQLESRLRTVSERMARTNHQINNLIDQVLGSRPEKLADARPVPPPRSATTIIDMVDELENRASELESTLSRMSI